MRRGEWNGRESIAKYRRPSSRVVITFRIVTCNRDSNRLLFCSNLYEMLHFLSLLLLNLLCCEIKTPSWCFRFFLFIFLCRMPMLDLLIHVTAANKISPAAHLLQVTDEEGRLLPHKPSTPIGMRTQTLCLLRSCRIAPLFYPPSPALHQLSWINIGSCEFIDEERNWKAILMRESKGIELAFCLLFLLLYFMCFLFSCHLISQYTCIRALHDRFAECSQGLYPSQESIDGRSIG